MSNIPHDDNSPKKDYKVTIKGMISIAVILLFCFIAFNRNGNNENPNKSKGCQKTSDSLQNVDSSLKTNTATNEDSMVTHLAFDSLKSNFNGDSLKDIFSKPPFNYEFTEKETTEQGTKETWVEGKQPESELSSDVLEYPSGYVLERPNTLSIYYELNSRKADKILMYLNHISVNVKINDLKNLFEFTDYFDPAAKNYIKKNFKNIFYNQSDPDSLRLYQNKHKFLKMGIDALGVFEIRWWMKKHGTKVPPKKGNIDTEIDFL